MSRSASPRSARSWDAGKSWSRCWRCTGRRRAASVGSSSSRAKQESARARSSARLSTRYAGSTDPVLIGYGQCVEQHGEREPFMVVLEALERLSRAPSGHGLRSLLRSIAPSWLAQMPSLLKPVALERLRRWHAEAPPLRMLREFASLVEAISNEAPLGARARGPALERSGDRGPHLRDRAAAGARAPDARRHLPPGGGGGAADHPIKQVLTLLRARARCTGRHARVPQPERGRYLPRAAVRGRARGRRGRGGRADVNTPRKPPVHDRPRRPSRRLRLAGAGRGRLAADGAPLDHRARRAATTCDS